MGDRSRDTGAGVGSGRATRGNTRSQAARMASPPASKTPPSVPKKTTFLYPEHSTTLPRAQEGSEPVDASALKNALKGYDEAGRRRERTPGPSPCRKRQRVYGDRYVVFRARGGGLTGQCPALMSEQLLIMRYSFIPNRDGQDLQATFSLLHEDGCPSTPSNPKRRAPHSELHFQKSS